MILLNQAELLKDVQQKYESISDFQSAFKQVAGNGHILTGNFYYKSKDKFKIELDNRTIVSDGESVWNYTSKNNKVIITTQEDNGTSFSLDNYIYNYPEKCNVSYEKQEQLDVIILKPNSPELDFKEVKLWVSGDYLVQKIQLIDLMNNRFKVTLKNFEVNTGLSDDYFTFTPQEGTKVIDLR